VSPAMARGVELKHPNPHMSSQEDEGMKKHSQVEYVFV